VQAKEVYGSKKEAKPRKIVKRVYELRDFDQNDEFDFKLMDALQGASLNYPVRKLFFDEESGGNFYLYGSKIILLRVNASGAFVVLDHRTKEESPLSSFLTANITKEYDVILDLLKGNKRSLMDRDDPVIALADEAESLFRREFTFGYKGREGK
jgi:hypothetical protein